MVATAIYPLSFDLSLRLPFITQDCPMKAILITLISAVIFSLCSCQSTSQTASHPRASDPVFALSSPVAANEPPLIH
jgi:hypothetical protein